MHICDLDLLAKKLKHSEDLYISMQKAY